MTPPTNTDLADALREIANTMPLGSALVLRLAADRLGADTDGWIEWDARAPDAHLGPKLPPRTELEVEIAGGTMRGSTEYWAYGVGLNNWALKGLASPKNVITRYRVVK